MGRRHKLMLMLQEHYVGERKFASQGNTVNLKILMAVVLNLGLPKQTMGLGRKVLIPREIREILVQRERKIQAQKVIW